MPFPKTDNPSSRKADRWCLFFLLAINTYYYRRILFLGEIPGGNDLQYQYFAWKNFFITSLKDGVFPFWNPSLFSGSPVVHEILAACFYPFDYLFLVLPLPWGFGLSYWFHLTVGAFIFYRLSGEFLTLRPVRLMAATTYMLSAPVLTRMGEGVPTMNQTYALIPLFFLVGKHLYEKPSLRLLGGFSWVCALFIYAGHPQLPFMAVQLLGAFLIYRAITDLRIRRPTAEMVRAGLFLALGGLLGVAIASPQAFPFLEYASYSATRAGGAKYSFAAEGSLPPIHLVTSIIPFLFGDPSNRTYWKSLIPFHETCGYLSAFGFFFAMCWIVLSKRKGTWIWFVISLATLLLAMGEFTPVHRFFYEVVPGWDRFRQPARAFFILAFSGSLLAGFGAERVVQAVEEGDRQSPRNLLILFGFILVLIGLALGYTLTHRQELLEGFSASMNRMMQQGTGQMRDFYVPEQFLHRYMGILTSLARFAAWVFLFLAWVFLLRRFPERRKLVLWALPAVVALDLLTFGSRFLVTHDLEGWKEKYYPDSPLMAYLQEHAGEGRLLVTDFALHWQNREKEPELYPNGPLYYGLRIVRGYNPTILRHYSRFINTIQGKDPDEFPGGLLFLDRIPQADLLGLRVLGVRFLVQWDPLPDPFTPERKFPNGLLLYRFDPGLPRTFRAQESENPWGLEPVERERDRTRIVESDCNHIVVETESDRAGWLVFNDCWFPGWTATVNGEPAEIHRAFHAFQRVRVPDGKSIVEWRFRPTFWNLYLAAALAAGLLATLLLFIRPHRSHPSSTS